MSVPEHSIASNRYGRYCIPVSSSRRPAAMAVLAGEVWEPRTLAFMAGSCGAGDIVHAGTYFGDFLPALSRALAPGARLWAFEPSAENHACAARTIALNGLENVSLFHAGLGPKPGTASLKIASARGVASGGSSSIAAKTSRGHFEDVRIVALDDIVGRDRDVSILQLDVEGYEQKALKGARALVERCRPLLILETLPDNPRWYRRNIAGLGYRAIGTIHGNSVFTAAAQDPPDFETFRDA